MTSNSSPDHRIKRLVAGLIAKTNTDDPFVDPLEWEQVGADSFDLNLSSSTISIFTRDRDSNFPFILRIIDETGREIETVQQNSPDEGTGLAELHRAVGRIFYDPDKKLKEIFGELGIPDDPSPF